MTAAQFPEGFLWGAATAAHQVEGGNVNNDHWEAEHSPHSPFAEPSGDACDSWHRWPEDLDLVAGAGLTAYRFSLEWSRIEPEEGEFSRAALDHYRRVLDGCRDRGLAPVVTLVHFTQPRWLLRDGGWTGQKTLDRLARFAEYALPVLADAEYVCTLNEPNLMAAQPVMGAMAMRGEEIRGLPRPDQGVAEALLGLHGRAMDVLRGNVRAAGMTLVGREHLAEPGGEERMREERAAFEDQFLEVARDDDFLGLQVYTAARFDGGGLVAPAPELQTLAHGMERRPQALGAAVARAAEVLPGLPLLVTENGIATADDDDRIAFTRDALTSLAGAVEGGADVRGYLHWSLLDNFEWMLGYRPTFGLVAVDRRTFARTPKPSLIWLGEVARRNGLA
ncbi:glycoside hydrolase family 1 protein [Geodermatophilus nigrescens]|uniref:Aryl-beta-glucosidase n=1 Tax=Geodermatophilus nigrescens TaxID=1070870 RepID=A0A1M5FT92_9ACTN|nr:family 1 glycosylhydrolase [Geodermatophilus nigrescens]SHF94755.1 aryl-beta-glucosidase [Geodermatophilus nigrescens]